MPLEPYDPCPCGSGKKLKFCCQAIVGEMERAAAFHERNQPRMALQVLDALEKKQPGNPWAVITRATILMEEDEFAEAVETLEPFVEDNPDHKSALALLASAELTADGFEIARPTIHRAFQKCRSTCPDLLGSLAVDIAAEMYAHRHFMACRQHLALALPLVDDEDRRVVFSRLLEFDGSEDVPYPLRSVHEPAEYAGLEDRQNEAARALRLVHIGCYGPAARLYMRLAEQEPDNPVLWHNAGLCRAWDADEPRAAVCLHRAAELFDDYARAVECETLAQLLDLVSSPDQREVNIISYEIESPARVLSQLDGSDRLVRLATSGDEDDEDLPAGYYYALDRPRPEDASSLTTETVPQVLAEVAVYNADPDENLPARLYVTGLEGEPLESVTQMLEELGGGAIEEDKEDEEAGKADETDETDEPLEHTLQSIPSEQIAFFWRWHFPLRTPVALRKRLHLEMWQQVVEEIWPDTPQRGLAGRTPREAAGNDSLRVPLAAALIVLDALAEQRNGVIDPDRLREQYRVPPPPPIELTEETSLHAFSPLELLRTPVGSLSDEQLRSALSRAILIGHRDYLYRVLLESLQRPAVLEDFDAEQIYLKLSAVCDEWNRRDESLKWIEKGREAAGAKEDAFEKTLAWDLRELTARLQEPADEELRPLLEKLARTYFPKLPGLKERVDALLFLAGAEAPWESSIRRPLAPEADIEEAAAGLWTPGSAAGETETPGEKKLWLPGQS